MIGQVQKIVEPSKQQWIRNNTNNTNNSIINNSNNNINIIPNICDKNYKINRNINCKIINNKKRFFCEYEGCNKSFVGKWYLKNHKRTHTKEKPYICEHCNRAFAQKSSRKRHIDGQHKNIKPYCCNINGCERRFTQKCNLKDHQKRKHFKNIKK